jgi:hypothetical protein
MRGIFKPGWFALSVLGSIAVVCFAVETAIAVCPNTEKLFQACPEPAAPDYMRCQDFGTMGECMANDGDLKKDGYFGTNYHFGTQAVPGQSQDTIVCYEEWDCAWTGTACQQTGSSPVRTHPMVQFVNISCDGT